MIHQDEAGNDATWRFGYRSTAQDTSQAAQLRQPCVNSHWLSLWEPCIFDPPPTESTSLNRSLKNLSHVVITSTTSTAVQNLVKIRPWGLLGK